MSEKGMASVMLLAFMPLLLAAAAVIGAAYLMIRSDGEARQLCRIDALAAQEIAADRLNKLLAMNAEAKALRAARAAAESAYAAAALAPEALPAAEAALDAIKTKQAIFAAEQQRLYLEGKSASSLRPRATSRRIESSVLRAHQLQQNDPLQRPEAGIALRFRSVVTPAEFDLVTEPKDSLTPDYQPSSEFEKKQLISIEWSFAVKALLPAWTHELVGKLDYRVQAGCRAKLEKGNDKWNPKLTDERANAAKL